MNSASREHVIATRWIARLLEDAVPSNFEVLPAFGWLAAPRTVFEPDLMVAPKDSPGNDLLRTPPLLVVEVASASTRGLDWQYKREAYAEAGAQHYWIIDLVDRELTTFRSTGRGLAQDLQFRSGKHKLTRPFKVTIDLDRLFS